MKGKVRRILATLLMAIFFAQTMAVNVLAEETTARERITKVKLRVLNEDGKVSFTSTEEDKYTVTTEERYFNVGSSNEEFEIEVEAKEHFYFENVRKSMISFSGDKTGVKCNDASEYGDNKVRFDIKITTIAGKLEPPYSAWWDDFGIACWDEVEGATGYRISINDSQISTDDRTSINLSSYLKWGKVNRFKVKAISSKSNVTNSSYTESDELDLTRDGECWDDYDNHYVKPRNNYQYYYQRGWIQSNGLWYFIDINNEIKKGWLDNNGKRYYLSWDDGHMLTGWQNIDWAWYFFATDGHMLTSTTITSANGEFVYTLNHEGKMFTNRWEKNWKGWYFIGDTEPIRDCERNIDGKTYRFNNEGYMITGWWWDGSNWYYYYPDGSKAYNTFVYLNGQNYRLDSDGRWVQ